MKKLIRHMDQGDKHAILHGLLAGLGATFLLILWHKPELITQYLIHMFY